jgi:hypothetical protein
MTGPDQTRQLIDEPRYRLRREVFDALAAQKQAPTINSQVTLTGVPRASLVRIRGGETPSMRNAGRIASALGVEIHVLFERVADR